ncbi:MAG: hydrogenase nickel incorporation protein HypB [Bacteroidales bacterium]|nr:hydrogenase nickel incorporation protein HypB [Bacteroidales bacterium]
MCDTCGCGQPDNVRITIPGEELKPGEHTHSHSHTHTHGDHEHTHGHDHIHSHYYPHTNDHRNDDAHHHEGSTHDHSHGKELKVEIDILQKNNLLAERNRGYFEAKNIFTLNLVSSPGSGKTSLLERTIQELGKELSFFIIEGDQQTMNDANRIQKAGAPVVQINTGNGCHLDAEMINNAIKKLDVTDRAVLFIENVGNLVCPAMFDLGESKRIVIMSVTEGDDKPIKYPTMFQSSDICIINKTDLLPYVDFDVEKAKEYALRVNPHMTFLELSVKTGEGMETWFEWLCNSSF